MEIKSNFLGGKITQSSVQGKTFFLVSESVLNKTVSCEIIPAYRSDHPRVILRQKLNVQARGKGFWKLNCSLLNDSTFLELVKKVIQETVYSYACPAVYNEHYLLNPARRKHVQMTVN